MSEGEGSSGSLPWPGHGPLPPSASVAEARTYIDERLSGGVTCPCCGSYLKIYARRLNRAKVRELLEIYRRIDETDGDYYDFHFLPDLGISLRNREYPKLRWWGLLEARDPDAGPTETTGYWRLTFAGVKFVRGELRVPNKVLEFRSEFLGFAEDASAVSVREALLDSHADREDI